MSKLFNLKQKEIENNKQIENNEEINKTKNINKKNKLYFFGNYLLFDKK